MAKIEAMTNVARDEISNAINDDVDIVYLDEYMITSKLMMAWEY